MKKVSILIMIVTAFISCSEKRSDVASECYELWSGQSTPKEIKVIHGTYWESAHWSKEYIMFLELAASNEWRRHFIQQNKMILAGDEWTKPNNIPDWFKPSGSSRQWILPDSKEGSRCFEDSVSGKLFIYEIQL